MFKGKRFCFLGFDFYVLIVPFNLVNYELGSRISVLMFCFCFVFLSLRAFLNSKYELLFKEIRTA